MNTFFEFINQYRKEITWAILVLNAISALLTLLTGHLNQFIIHVTLVVAMALDLIDRPK